jgi:hypothetical protein
VEDIPRDSYKGFLEVGENNFVIVCETTACEFVLENPDARFAILDEILYKGILFGEPIDSLVKTMFHEHEYMKFILDKNRHPFPLPVCLYPLEKVGVDYENSVYEEGSVGNIDQSGFDAQVDHPIFGSIFLFSTQQVDETPSPGIKRFAGFMQDVLYILNKNFELEENLSTKKDEFQEFSGVSFYERGIELVAFSTDGVFLEI